MLLTAKQKEGIRVFAAKQKEFVRVWGWKISLRTIATTVVSTILIMIFNVMLRYAKPEAWGDYVNTKFITTSMNLVFLYGSLVTFILLTGGYDALKNSINFETDEARKYSTGLLALLIGATTYLCSIGL
jgi:hypothetical protein